MSPVEAIFVPFPPKTGTNLLHPLPLSIVERVQTGFLRTTCCHPSLLLVRRQSRKLLASDDLSVVVSSGFTPTSA